MENNIKWIVIPKGIRRGKAILSVVIVPELSGPEGATLGSSAEGSIGRAFMDWPAALGGLEGIELSILPELAGAKKLFVGFADSQRSRLNSELWQLYFPESLRIDTPSTQNVSTLSVPVQDSYSSYKLALGAVELKRAVIGASLQKTARAAAQKGSGAAPTRLSVPSVTDLFDPQAGRTWASLSQEARLRIDPAVTARAVLTSLGQCWLPVKTAHRSEADFELYATKEELDQVRMAFRSLGTGEMGAMAEDLLKERANELALTRRFEREAQRSLATQAKDLLRKRSTQRIGDAATLRTSDELSMCSASGRIQALEEEILAMSAYLAPGDARSLMHLSKVLRESEDETCRFDARIGMIQSEPRLLPMLGLALDFEVDGGIGEMYEGWNGAAISVAVEPVWKENTPPSKGGVEHLLPWTRCRWGDAAVGERFLPAPSENRHFAATPRGVVKLRAGRSRLGSEEMCVASGDTASYHLQTFQVAGVSKKLEQFAVWLADRHPSRTTAAPAESEDALTPTFQTDGISLYMNNRAASAQQDDLRLSRASTAASARGDGREKILHLEDLVLGFRFDIWDDHHGTDTSKSWRPLCARHVDYAHPALHMPTPVDKQRDEGVIRLVERDHSTSPSVELVGADEKLFTWKGHPLAVPPEGRDAYDHGCEASSAPEPCGPRPIEVQSRTPHRSQTPLRFGTSYRVGARAVYLDGTGPGIDEAITEYVQWSLGDTSAADKPLKFLRWEPVGSPEVHLAAQLDRAASPGEQMDLIVVRSERTDRFRPGESVRRFLVPPRVTQDVAEMHGMFDRRMELERSAFEGVVLSDDGSFPSQPGADQARDTRLVFAPDIAKPPKRPYYPDPFARRAFVRIGYKPGGSLNSFEAIRDAAGEEICIPIEFYSSRDGWPSAYPICLEVIPVARRDGKPPVTWELHRPWGGVSRGPSSWPVLRICVSEAEKLTLLVSSGIDRSDLEAMALVHAVLTKDERTSALVESLIRCGGHWALTPWRELTVVHAVRQPLTPPGALAVEHARERPRNATYQDLAFELEFDRKSSGVLEGRATWTEFDDTGVDPEHPMGKATGTAFELKVAYFQKPTYDDDRARLVTVMAERESEIRCEVRHEFHDTKHRLVDYSVAGTSQFVDNFSRRPNDGETFKRISEQNSRPEMRSRRVRIRSCAPPAAPKLLYLMPTFRWRQEQRERESRSERYGGGIRVWMERGWFSSGEGEKLAVVFTQKTFRELTLPESDIVTLWGGDSVFGGQAPRDPIALSDLRGHAAPAHDLAVPNLSNVKVSAAPYEVRFDKARKLWYCDIEIDPGRTYFPFVRLALARYQPHSIRDVELSEVVQAEFIQLTPNRFASIFVNPHNDRKVRISVTGFSFSDEAAGGARRGAAPTSRMEVEVQERCEGLGRDGELGWAPVERDPNVFAMDSRRSRDGGQTWFSEIELPERVRCNRFRFVVREFHQFFEDLAGTRKAEQCVYADVLAW